ncbi:hypothetical protein [Azospirillum thermophilum]|nr:hypothetical protein [Azospirillum thermophilum]
MTDLPAEFVRSGMPIDLPGYDVVLVAFPKCIAAFPGFSVR